jgi:hypothetical protein
VLQCAAVCSSVPHTVPHGMSVAQEAELSPHIVRHHPFRLCRLLPEFLLDSPAVVLLACITVCLSPLCCQPVCAGVTVLRSHTVTLSHCFTLSHCRCCR